MSQGKLAAAARELDPDSAVYQARVTDWELGKDLPSLRQLAIVALVLDLPAAEFGAGRALWDAAQLVGLPFDHLSPPEPDGTSIETPTRAA